jgi:hypothetical protein
MSARRADAGRGIVIALVMGMPGFAPTAPASIYHPERADAVQQLKCAIPSADDPTVLDFTRGGILI